MKGRKIYWALINGGVMLSALQASIITDLPLTSRSIETAALFNTRQQARSIASKLPPGFAGYEPVKVRVCLEVVQ